MKLTTKLRSLFIGISCFPIVLCSVFLLVKAYNSNTKTQYQYFDTFCKNSALNVSSFFQQHMAINAGIAKFPDIGNLRWENVEKPLKEIVAAGNVEKIILAKKDGTYFNTTGANPYLDNMQTSDNKSPNATKSSIAIRDYFKDMVTNNAAGRDFSKVSEPVISLSNGVRQIMICTTIFDDNRKLNGMLASAISFGLLEQKLDEIHRQAMETFKTDVKILILNANGNIVYHWDADKNVRVEEKNGSKVSVTSTIDELAADFKSYAQQMVAQQADFQTVEYKLDGERCLFCFDPIEGTNMTIGMFIDRGPLYADIYGQIKTSIVYLLIMTVLVVLIAIFFSRGLINPLRGLADSLGELAAGGGDLTFRLPVMSNDVISRMSKNFNEFLQTLRDIISTIQKESKKLGSVSTDLHKNVQVTKDAVEAIGTKTNDLSQNAVNLSASIEETTSTVHQMGKTIDNLSSQITTQSNSVNDSSAAIEEMVANIQSVTTNLNRASKTFNELKTSSENGRNTMEAVIESIKATAQHSQQLLETNDMIEAIASQTNLLAMNAAIEAAHAGDAGKGFSVVADEIRKLAEDSSEQTKKIAEVLRIVVGNIEAVVDQSNNANTAFEDISTQIGNVSGLMSEISMSMNEQAEGSQQVLESLKNIQIITSQILDGSTEMTTGANMIQKEMIHLRDFAYQVKDVVQIVSNHVDQINASVDGVAALSDQNNDLSERLIKQTNGFKL